MFSFDYQIRVRYADTDQMGYVYYGNYAAYLEVSRVESFRHLGLSYKLLEESGVMMPVLEYKTKYIRPAKYDDLLTIKLFIKEMPTTRVRFEYEIYNEQNILLNVSETTLVFVSTTTGRPVNAPENFKSLFNEWFL